MDIKPINEYALVETGEPGYAVSDIYAIIEEIEACEAFHRAKDRNEIWTEDYCQGYADGLKLALEILAEHTGITQDENGFYFRKLADGKAVNPVIKSIAMLKRLAKDGAEFSICLMGGLRSSKHITYNEQSGNFMIVNYIDGTSMKLSERELFTNSNIGKAIESGALILS